MFGFRGKGESWEICTLACSSVCVVIELWRLKKRKIGEKRTSRNKLLQFHVFVILKIFVSVSYLRILLQALLLFGGLRRIRKAG